MSSSLKVFLLALVIAGVFYKRDQIQLALEPWLKTKEPAPLVPGTPQPNPALVAVHPAPQPVAPPEPVTPEPPPMVQDEAPATALSPDPADSLPENVYLLLERVPIVSDAGVRGVAAGTEVVRIGEKDGQWIVRDSQGEFAVHPDKLTRNPKDIPSPEVPVTVASMAPEAADSEAGLFASEDGDPYEAIREMHIGRIAELRASLSREYGSLENFKRAFPNEISPTTNGATAKAIFLSARARIEEKIRDQQEKLKAMPPPKKS